MNDEMLEHLELLQTALREAAFLLRGRWWPSYGPDDLAQDALYRFIKRKAERPDEVIPHPKAILKRMVNDLYLNAAEKFERRARLDQEIPPPSEGRSLVEEYEDIEEAVRKLRRIKASPPVLRVIMELVRQGHDVLDRESRAELCRYCGIDPQRFSSGLHRLKEAAQEPLEEDFKLDKKEPLLIWKRTDEHGVVSYVVF